MVGLPVVLVAAQSLSNVLRTTIPVPPEPPEASPPFPELAAPFAPAPFPVPPAL